MGEGRKEKRERIAVNKGRLLLLKIEERSGVGRIYTLHLDDGYTHTIIHSVSVYFSVHTSGKAFCFELEIWSEQSQFY